MYPQAVKEHAVAVNTDLFYFGNLYLVDNNLVHKHCQNDMYFGELLDFENEE